MRRIHVVGCSERSGTTLVAEMMVACFELDLHQEHETRIYTWPSGRARVYLTKRPRDIVVVEPILRIMPQLYIITMVRDPRDIIVSRHRACPDRYWASLQYWKAFTPYVRRLLDHPRVSTIRYEDLVSDPDRIQDELMERMPWLVKRAPFSEFHNLSRPSELSRAALGSVRPVSRASIGNWREHKPRVAGQLRTHGPITADLIEFGYESDSTWEEELEGVEPDLSDSHGPEFFTDEMERWRKGAGVKAAWVLMGQYAPFRALHRVVVRVERAVKSLRRLVRHG